MRFLLFICFVFFVTTLQAQNVGIGTANPQQKLHVAGGVRIDGLAGLVGGIIVHNDNGDLSSLNSIDDTSLVLRANGTWGSLSGTVAQGTVVASSNYNDAGLKSKGFTLLGFIPGFTQYSGGTGFAPANSWQPTYVEGDPERYVPPYFDDNKIMFWADSVLYVFANNQFYIYNPISDNWRSGGVNPSAFTASIGCKNVWTGTELIVWGGNYTNATNNGFRYNPVTNTFTAIPTTGQPSARDEFAFHFINNRLVVWGGRSGGSVVGDGAVLNLATNTWSNISATGAPAARRDFSSVVNTLQNTMIVWGGNTSVGVQTFVNNGAMYNPVTNTWAPMSATNAPVVRNRHSYIWSGTEMILFGGHGQFGGEEYYNSGGRYNPATNTWTAMSTTGAPGLELHAAVWTGSRMLVSGGLEFSLVTGAPFVSGSWLYDPVANTWQSASSMRVGKASHRLINAGNVIIAMGGSTTIPNAISGTSAFIANTVHGSRYFLTATTMSYLFTDNREKLYLYIKQ